MTQGFFAPLPKSDFNQDKMVTWLQQQTISFQKIITGALQVGQELTSANYDEGVAGWAIDGDGNAEFNDALFRGTIVTGTDGQLSLEPLDFPRIVWSPTELNTDGYISMGATNIGGGDIGTVIISAPFDSGGGAELVIFAQTGVGGNMLSFDGGLFSMSDGVVQVAASAGASRPAYSFTTDTDTGMYLIAGNQLGFSAAGTLQFRTSNSSSNPGLVVPTGTSGAPSIRAEGDPNTGINMLGGDTMDLVQGGSATARVGNSFAIVTPLTTGGGTPLAVTSSGLSDIRRQTSSLKYKPDWRYKSGLENIELPDPIEWTDEEGETRIGFGAEHIYEVLPESMVIENYDNRAVLAVLAAKVKRLEQKSCHC